MPTLESNPKSTVKASCAKKNLLGYIYNVLLYCKSADLRPMGTRIVQADSGSDSDSESRRRSPRRLPAGWYRRVQADYWR